MGIQQQINSGIKRLRHQHNMTQECFAEAVRNLEHNKYAPRAITVDKICARFNVRLIDLLFDVPTDNALKLHKLIADKLLLYSKDELFIISKILDLINCLYNMKL